MLQYSINIIWSDEDEGYIATMPEFKNLSTFGKTYEEAIEEAKIAAEGYIEALKEENLPPPAAYKLSNYSGQTRLRIPRILHQRLTEEAQRQGVSLNTYMVSLLSVNYGFSKVLPLQKRAHLFMLYYRGSESETSIQGEKLFGRVSEDKSGVDTRLLSLLNEGGI